MFAASKTASVSGGYQISRSLRFNAPDSANLSRTFGTPTNNFKFTYSIWVKRGTLGAVNMLLDGGDTTGNNNAYLDFNANDQLVFFQNTLGIGVVNLITTQVFRDPSAWYHIVLAVDTTQATDTNRVKLYANGVQITSFGTATYPTLNLVNQINLVSQPHFIGKLDYSSLYLSAYMTEVNFIDGQQLTPSSFGETNAQTGVWQPIAYLGSYGTNGFYLNFSDNSNTTAATLGKDYSTNGNNWTPNNFSVTAGVGNDSLVDSPTNYGGDNGVGGNVRGNYSTLNPLFVTTSAGTTNPTLANGNLNFVGNITTDTSGRSTIGVTSGKWYCEVTVSYVSAAQDGLGIAYTQSDSSRSSGVLYRSSGDKCVNNTVTSYGTNYVAGSLIGIALDADNNTITFYNSNNSQGAISFTPTTQIYFSTYGTNSSPAFGGDINFGQRPFVYTAPNGYQSLCTQNLPTPTIGATTATQAGKFFNPVLYTGTGSSLSVTGVGFQPDLVWAKSRSAATEHAWYDAVRGVQKQLESNNTDAETTETTGLTAFNSDGFTTGALAQMNTSAATYVAWNWKANGSSSTNTSGSITSTVSANITSGFSIATYTGAAGTGGTIGHGLGVAPSMYIVKCRGTNGSTSWAVYHKSIGAGSYVLLNGTGASTANNDMWNNTAPTSTVFSVGTLNEWASGSSANTYVAYCFAPVSGYSAFGLWTGNGSADGPFVFTGFKPAYILWKRTDSSAGGDWGIVDATRNPSNVVGEYLAADTSGAGATYSMLDMVSNGFKIRWSDTSTNASGGTYIYMAFASSPFKYSLAR